MIDHVCDIIIHIGRVAYIALAETLQEVITAVTAVCFHIKRICTLTSLQKIVYSMQLLAAKTLV